MIFNSMIFALNLRASPPSPFPFVWISPLLLPFAFQLLPVWDNVCDSLAEVTQEMSGVHEGRRAGKEIIPQTLWNSSHHHPWECSKNMDIALRAVDGEHHAGLVVGLDDPKSLFQP